MIEFLVSCAVVLSIVIVVELHLIFRNVRELRDLLAERPIKLPPGKK